MSRGVRPTKVEAILKLSDRELEAYIADTKRRIGMMSKALLRGAYRKQLDIALSVKAKRMEQAPGGLTNLERVILQRICDRHPSEGAALRPTLATAQVVERANTGHGFYTTFEVGSLTGPVFPEGMNAAPCAYMRDMGPGMLMGFLLWASSGETYCLEGFQYGDENGDTVDLRERDLRTLAWDRFDDG